MTLVYWASIDRSINLNAHLTYSIKINTRHTADVKIKCTAAVLLTMAICYKN